MPPDGRLSDPVPPDSRQTSAATVRACLAVSATFTAEAIQPALQFWLTELPLSYEVRFAPYNQVFQQLLDPSGLLARNAGGINVVLIRFEDWGAGAEQNAARLADALRHSAAPVILAVCPPTAAHAAESAAAEAALRGGAAALPSVHLITSSDLCSLYPVAGIHDPDADRLGHVPYTPLFFAALGTMVIRKLHAIQSVPYKVIALDCDDTLWQGVCGEDGPQGVVLDPPRRALQQFMRAQREAGMLLTVCSKNNEDDVTETFRAQSSMPLRWDDFVATRINWDSKCANLEDLADELGLGLDSFILVDDNPKECTEAQSGCPEVLALALPPEAEQIPEFLKHVWAFDHPRVTEEDRQRSALYAQQVERVRLERSSGSLDEFIRSLRLEVRIAPVAAGQWSRVAQLTQRTNQMNFSSIRRVESDLAQLRDAECLAVEVSDRFGSYGLTGVVIYRVQAPALVVDTFLLSCRVLGRGVEHRLLARLGEIAMERGLARIDLPFVPSPRNKPARLFLDSVARTGADGIFRMTAQEAAAVRYVPNAARPSPARGDGPAPPARARIDYARIANDLRDPRSILDHIQASQRPENSKAPGAAEPRTPLERDLATLWAELLHLPRVGVRDNFFELGGHSLLAVQLLSRVRRIYAVDLSLEVVYTGEFTVAELAKAIELKEIEQAAGGEYQDLLKELEGLSDEEVRALLEQEQGGA